MVLDEVKSPVNVLRWSREKEKEEKKADKL
jgi:hypothetical protein